MKPPSISLKRTLDVTLKDVYRRLYVLDDKDCRALRGEYQEWLIDGNGESYQPHVLYMNQLFPDS